jgi:hypothetical protein
MAKLVAQAKREWESSALEWMVAVLRRLRALRPRARFGIHSAEIVAAFYRLPNANFCQDKLRSAKGHSSIGRLSHAQASTACRLAIRSTVDWCGKRPC